MDGACQLHWPCQHVGSLQHIGFCCVATDTFIQKTKKLFQDSRSQRNLAMLNDDLAEVHTIMTKNIQEVLGQGEKLDSEWPPVLLQLSVYAV